MSETFAVKLRGINEPSDSTKVKKVIESVHSSKKHNLSSPRVKQYLYRKEVEIDLEKLSKHRSEVEGYDWSRNLYFHPFKRSVKSAIADKTLERKFFLEDPDIYNYSISKIVEIIFESNNDMLDLSSRNGRTISVSYEDYLYHEYVSRLKRDLTEYSRLVGKVGTEVYLPILVTTQEYIKFESSQTLVSMLLDCSSTKRLDLTNSLLNMAITSVYSLDGVEVVNASEIGDSKSFNLLLPNESLGETLIKLKDIYLELEDYLIESNYSLSINIDHNVGQDNGTSEWYCMLSGSHYKDLKNHFSFIKDYKGLEIYK